MNTKVRTHLVELARNPINQTVTYQVLSNACKLGLDMGNPDHRKAIGKILGEISDSEHQNGRPLLSALVIRLGDGYEGDGFFKLAEELGYGKWKKLRDSDFDIEQIRECIDFWKNDTNYAKYKEA